MVRLIAKYQSIYLFIITLSLVGFITGYFYYLVQDNNTKTYIIENINIKETLNKGVNNIPKRTKLSFTILISSLFIITIILNIIKTFTISFEIGFITSVLKIYSFKFSLIYISIYYLIPYIITLILIRISITISINILKLLIKKDKKIKIYLKKQFTKYLIIYLLLISYELMISLFSYNINIYLMTIIGFF